MISKERLQKTEWAPTLCGGAGPCFALRNFWDVADDVPAIIALGLRASSPLTVISVLLEALFRSGI
jgi:hypothetical protein